MERKEDHTRATLPLLPCHTPLCASPPASAALGYTAHARASGGDNRTARTSRPRCARVRKRASERAREGGSGSATPLCAAARRSRYVASAPALSTHTCAPLPCA